MFLTLQARQEMLLIQRLFMTEKSMSLLIPQDCGRKSKIKEELERYSIIRTVTAVERADVVLMVIDATEGVTEQDAKIAGIAHEQRKRRYHCSE